MPCRYNVLINDTCKQHSHQPPHCSGLVTNMIVCTVTTHNTHTHRKWRGPVFLLLALLLFNMQCTSDQETCAHIHTQCLWLCVHTHRQYTKYPRVNRHTHTYTHTYAIHTHTRTHTHTHRHTDRVRGSGPQTNTTLLTKHSRKLHSLRSTHSPTNWGPPPPSPPQMPLQLQATVPSHHWSPSVPLSRCRRRHRVVHM